MGSAFGAIILVDDNPANLRAGKNVLADKFEVFTVPSARKMFELLETITPSLILLDIEMPEMSGYEAIKILKKQPPTRDIPVIFLTGKTDADDELEGLSLGAIDYITKPFIPLLLLKRVEIHLLVETQRLALHEISRRYLSPEIVDYLLKSPMGLELGGQKKFVSILMCDIRGFTLIAEQMNAESVVTMLNYFFRVMGKIIYTYGGTVIEFMGDAMLVAFGAVKDNPHHADYAVACALRMQKAMIDVNEWNEFNGFPSLEMGIGINTGNAVVGNIGNSQKMSFNIIGSSVNLASRIESLTTGGQVLISDCTYKSVSANLSVVQTTQVHPKGSAPISVHCIDGLGAPYNLSIKAQPEPLVEIPTPIQTACYKIVDKKIVPVAYKCAVTAISSKEGVLSGAADFSRFDYIKLNLDDGAEIFAKVAEKQSDRIFVLRWTFGAKEIFARAKNTYE
jgi:class 3 adenylate cyclase/CheY-like chemotaxis protein